MYHSFTRRIAAGMTILALAISAFAMLAPFTNAQTTCSFTRDLALGATGEDVRCLQKYLNAKGFTIATSGVGSAGQETNQYQSKTVAAVAKWQTTNGISPASGTFGPKSRAKYTALVGGSASSGSPSPAIPSSNSSVTVEARVAILAAISAYEDAVDDNGNDGDLEDASNLLHDAFVAFLNGNLSQAKSLANSAEDKADEAVGNDDDEDEDEDDGDDNSDESDAEEAIDDLDQAIEDAWEEYDDTADAEDTDANELLEEAEDLLEDAKDAFDDEDYDEVIDLVDEAMDLIDEALDEIGSSDDDDDDNDEDAADEALEDADNAIDDLKDAIDEAQNDGDDTDDAEDFLTEAEESYDEALDAFNDEDWKEAIEEAEQAEDAANDGLDELD